MTAMLSRLARYLPSAVLQVVALVLAHELVFIARFGSRYNEALVHAGHGETWSVAVPTSLLLAVGLATVAALRLAQLGLLVRRHGHAPAAPGGALEPRPLLRAWLRIAPRMALLGVVLLSIQENVERSGIGQSMPGPGILLTPEYAGGLWITIGVCLAVGFVAALFDWRRRVLLAKLQATRPSIPRGATAWPGRPGIVVLPPVQSILGRRSALRAPPLGSAS